MANQECVKSIFDEFKQYTLNRVECNDICFQATKKHFNKPQSPGEKNLSFSDPQMTAHPPRNSFSHQTKKYRNPWGNLSYANLIAAAILSSQRKKMKLNEIYNWFVHNIPYFALREDDMKSRGWKNSIRHNLSLKKDFIRESGDKKAGYWYINQKAFLTRLKAENRQINDPGYNKDMEIFELYVQQIFSNNPHKIEDFINFSKNKMPGYTPNSSTSNQCAKSNENPFYFINKATQFSNNFNNDGGSCSLQNMNNQFSPTRIQNGREYLEKMKSFDNTSIKIFPTINENNNNFTSNVSCTTPFSNSQIIYDKQNAPFNSTGDQNAPFNSTNDQNANNYAANGGLSVAQLNENLVYFSQNNPYMTSNCSPIGTILAGNSVENDQNKSSQILYSPDAYSNANGLFSFSNCTIPVQSYEIVSGQANSPALYRPIFGNFINGGYSNNFNNSLPIVFNRNTFTSDISGSSLKDTGPTLLNT